MGYRGIHHTSSSDFISRSSFGDRRDRVWHTWKVFNSDGSWFFVFKTHYRVSNSGVIPLGTINVTEMQQTVKAIFARSEV